MGTVLLAYSETLACLMIDSMVSVLSAVKLSCKYCRIEAAKRWTLVIGCAEDPFMTTCLGTVTAQANAQTDAALIQ